VITIHAIVQEHGWPITYSYEWTLADAYTGAVPESAES
jgi:hypothetical protein